MSLKHIALTFCAGGVGALSRFALTSFGNNLLGYKFPFGTFIVNIIGCFLFGLIWRLIGEQLLPDTVRVIVLVGFIGSFTTFSSYIFDSFILLENHMFMGISNIIAQILVSFLALYLGISGANIISNFIVR